MADNEKPDLKSALEKKFDKGFGKSTKLSSDTEMVYVNNPMLLLDKDNPMLVEYIPVDTTVVVSPPPEIGRENFIEDTELTDTLQKMRSAKDKYRQFIMTKWLPVLMGIDAADTDIRRLLPYLFENPEAENEVISNTHESPIDWLDQNLHDDVVDKLLHKAFTGAVINLLLEEFNLRPDQMAEDTDKLNTPTVTPS